MYNIYHRFFSLLLLLVAFCVFGCDSGDGDSPGDGGDGDDTATNIGDRDGGIDEDDSDTGSEEPDKSDQPLFPHAVGNSWTYRYTWEDGVSEAACEAGEWTARLMDVNDIDGVETYTYLNPCVYNVQQDTVLFQFDGDNVIMVDYDPPYYMLAEPVEDGAGWDTLIQTSYVEYKWHEVGTVTVQAGTFDHCWERRTEDNRQYLTYCRGVGRVSGGTRDVFTSELVDYHLASD